MREILFRAKRIDNGEWVEGFYSELPKPSLGAAIVNNGALCAEDISYYIIVNKNGQSPLFSSAVPLEVVECEQYEVDPETVCQYASLTDKNGKKIWENDYISCKQYIGGNQIDYHVELGYVEMKHGAFGLHRKQGYYRPFKDWLEDYEYEVIGNIFDNPGLLEGSE